MKSSVKKISLAVLVAAFSSAPCLYAQAQNILFGRTTVTLDSSFLATFGSVNATVTLLDGTALNNGSANFTAVTGALNTGSLAGEVFHAGGYLINVGQNSIRLQNFNIDTTNTAAPVISALLIVNGNVIGRVLAFNELGSSNFSFLTQPGAAQLSGINLFLSSALAANLNSLVGQQVFQPGQLVGTDTQSLFFAATPTGSN